MSLRIMRAPRRSPRIDCVWSETVAGGSNRMRRQRLRRLIWTRLSELQMKIIQMFCGELSKNGRNASWAESVSVSHSSRTRNRGLVSAGSRQSVLTNGIILARIASSERSSAAFKIRHVWTFMWLSPQILFRSHSTVEVFPDPGGPYKRRCCRCSGWAANRPNIC